MIQFSKLSLILTTLAFFSIISCAEAQFSGGGKLGLNLANLRGSSVQNTSMLVGYNVGGFVNYSMENLLTGDIAEILSAYAELSVETKGTVSDYPFLATPESLEVKSDVKQNFTYVQVPILARFTFGEKKGLKYFGEGGFYSASLFGLTVDGEKSRDHDSDPNTDPRKYRQEYSGFDFGICLGGGVMIPFGGRKSPWTAIGNVRYSLGLVNIGDYKENTLDLPEELFDDMKTNTLSISFGVGYKIE
jgi:hypothetical protein